MKLTIKSLLLCLLSMVFLAQSCNKDDTYADLVKREKKQISAFLTKGIPQDQQYLFDPRVKFPIKVISEAQFEKNNQATDTTTNEYVLFGASGVYMQIVQKGSGKKLERGENENVLCRYVEFNIARDTIQSSNLLTGTEQFPEQLFVSNQQGNITGSFKSGIMLSMYKSKAIPTGWLIPLRFINLGRLNTPNSQLAKVRVIVPSTQGQENAATQTYPCFYEITYQAGR